MTCNRRRTRRNRRLDVLLQAEDVAEGVGEPGHLGASGSGPDAEGVLVVHAGVTVEGDSGGGEFGDDGCDVFDAPAENGEALGLEVAGEGGAEHGAVEVEDEREGRLVVHEGEAELV